MPDSVLITNAMVVYVESAVVCAGQAIAIRDGRIEAMSDSPEGHWDRTIDADGAYACPGLIDCHVHLFLDASADPVATLLRDDDEAKLRTAAANAKRALEAGITTVRDCGGPADLVPLSPNRKPTSGCMIWSAFWVLNRMIFSRQTCRHKRSNVPNDSL